MRGPLGAIIGRYPASDGDAQMDGIIKHNRKCRDVVFLILFIAFWIAMIVNSSLGFNQGNPLRLTYGLDYKGNVCGDKHADPDLRELELRYWVNPNQVYESGLKNGQFKLANARSICLMECPIPAEDSLNWICDYPDGDIHISMNDWIDRNYDYFEFLTPDMRNSSLQLQGPCYPVIFPSINVFWSCQIIARASNMSLRHWQQMGGVNINEDIIIDKSIHKTINSRSAVLKRYVADIGKAWPVLIVCGAIMPLFLSVIWLLMIRHFVAGMTWITVILFNVLIISVTMFYYLKAGWIGNDAISPIIGESDPYYNVSGREQNHLRAVSVLMTIIMGIAILSSIAIVRRILMATSVLKPEIPFLPVFSSMKRLMRYSLGSVAIGSLVVSFVESVRYILEFIRRKFKVANATPESCIGKVGFHSSQSCRGCIDWTVKSVNRNAYIMIAIMGKGFFRASSIATGLIVNNILRIGRVNVIGDVILFLGKLCVSLSSAVFAFLMLDTHKYRSAHNKISSPLFPVLVCWWLGYVVATLFFAVVEMSIDTIILSFCQDSEEHQGNAQYAPPLLLETLNDQSEMQRLTQGSS
ncbi:choline transporter protein 1 isoform X3 [Telopea speciosissima]|uniref:choline transporter protein 1 isoform X3 n=1 Tax=Telopea speciosissima TaxID=54955 RepID=UPI001CC3E103|nr:choline transporter protein 1 isoform X3 [Telopea speciosissima]